MAYGITSTLWSPPCSLGSQLSLLPPVSSPHRAFNSVLTSTTNTWSQRLPHLLCTLLAVALGSDYGLRVLTHSITVANKAGFCSRSSNCRIVASWGAKPACWGKGQKQAKKGLYCALDWLLSVQLLRVLRVQVLKHCGYRELSFPYSDIPIRLEGILL